MICYMFNLFCKDFIFLKTNMKTSLKIFLLWLLTFGVLQSFSFAEGEKVIIDPDTKKIIIQSWDQNLDLDTLKNQEQQTEDTATNNEEWKNEDANTTWNTIESTEQQETSSSTSETTVSSPLYDELEEWDEMDKALYWMFHNWLTKYEDLSWYRPDDPLLREEAAKIIGQAYDILWYPKEIKNTECSFADSNTFDPSLSSYIESTCSYWIFRWSNWSFLAQKSLSKAESLTVLIRILEWALSSEDFNPWWTLYFVKAKNVSLSNESDVNSLDRPITRREIALLIYRFKNIVLNSQLNDAAKAQLSIINQDPNKYVPQQENKDENSSNEDKKEDESINNDFLWVLSWVDFGSTTSLSILNSPEVVEAIQWMKEHGLTNAKDTTAYNPFDYLTREQAAKMFAQFAKALWYSALSWEVNNCEFSDLKDADPSLKNSIQEVCNLWLMQGSNWLFSPKTTITKSQFITMLIRLYEWKRLDESWNPRWAQYFLKAGELWILNAWDISSFEGLLTRYEAALLFYRFQLKQTISSWLNTQNLKNELLSTVKDAEWNYAQWDDSSSYAVTVDSNLLKNQFFQEGFLELLWTRYTLKKTDMTIFDLWDESFVWYWDLIDIMQESKAWTVNFIVSNGNLIQWTIRLLSPEKTWIVKESKTTTAWFNLTQN